MADTNPFAQFATAPAVAAEANPFAQFQEQPGYAEDVVKSVAPALAKGVISIPALPGDLASLTGGIANKVIDKDAKREPEEADFLKALQGGQAKLQSALPTSKDIQGGVEKVTGPFYESKTGPGKAVSTGLEVLPSIALGGGGLPGILAKSAGAGVTSELAGEGADALKGHLPTSVAPYAEPVARAVGAAGGIFTPAGVRKLVTPNPMNDAQLATVSALRASNPELVNASTAGQLTQSPRLKTLEGGAPRMANVPVNQEAAYTRGVMRQAGSDGMFDTPGLAQAKSRGAELDALQNRHEMNPSQFGLLNQYAGTRNMPGSELYKEVGPSKSFQDVVDALKNGPGGGNPAPMSMTGPRYGAMKQITQNAGEAAPTTHEQTAIFDLRSRMQNAFHNSMPDAEAQHLRDLDRQYSNYKTIENIPTKAGQNTVTPDQVFSKAPRGSDLETHANQAQSVMTPLPKPNHEIPPWADLGISAATSLLGGGAHGATGGGLPGLLTGGAEGGVLGHLLAPSIYQTASKVVPRIVARPGMQSYLANQAWRPGPNSTTDREDLIRLLMSPQAKQVAGPSQ